MKHELITFEVAGQLFGLDIMAVREIRAWAPATRLPQVPHYVVGVVNLRGTVLPVIDLASRLGWPPTEPTPRHAMVVVQLGGRASGLIVDSVSDIITLSGETLQPVPGNCDEALVPFLQGIAALEERMVMVLDLERLGQGEFLAAAA